MYSLITPLQGLKGHGSAKFDFEVSSPGLKIFTLTFLPRSRRDELRLLGDFQSVTKDYPNDKLLLVLPSELSAGEKNRLLVLKLVGLSDLQVLSLSEFRDFIKSIAPV